MFDVEFIVYHDCAHPSLYMLLTLFLLFSFISESQEVASGHKTAKDMKTIEPTGISYWYAG